MRRLLLLSVCVLLTSALTANADSMLYGVFTCGAKEAIQLNFTRTAQTKSYTTGLDLITITIAAMTNVGTKPSDGSQAKVVSVGTPGGTGYQPHWWATNVSDRFYVLDDPNYGPPTPSFALGTPAPGSYVAMEGTKGTTVLTVGSGPQYFDAGDYYCDPCTYLEKSWYTTSNEMTTGSIFAKFYVPNGNNISFQGGLGLNNSTGDFCLGTAGVLIPEPGTMVMLASGAIGWLAYVWRKRKRQL